MRVRLEPVVGMVVVGFALHAFLSGNGILI
jgi:hypothetical protein